MLPWSFFSAGQARPATNRSYPHFAQFIRHMRSSGLQPHLLDALGFGLGLGAAAGAGLLAWGEGALVLGLL